MSKIYNFKISNKSDLIDYLSGEIHNLIDFVNKNDAKLYEPLMINSKNLCTYVTTDNYGKYILSNRFGPATDIISQITTRFKILGIKFLNSTQKINRDDEQLIYTMEEISELSFGSGHEMKTLTRIIYAVQGIIADKHNDIKIGHIPHRVVNGLLIDFPKQFVNKPIKTNVGINVIDIRFDCNISGHNIRLLKTFEEEIQRVICGEYDVVQTSVLSCGDSFKRYIKCPYKDIVGVYNHFIATDEITDETYNHVINSAFLFMNIIPLRYNRSWIFHTLNTAGFATFKLHENAADKLPCKIHSKLNQMNSILNSNKVNIPNQFNDWNYMLIVENNQFDFKVPRYITNNRISLSNDVGKIEFRFYDFMTNETHGIIHSKIFYENKIMSMTNVGEIIHSITKNKIINMNTIPKEIIYQIILHLKYIDNHVDKDQNTDVAELLDELMTYNVLSVGVIYIILTYIESRLGNQFLKIISENVPNQLLV